MIDTCAIANSAPSEYALCLLNWDCESDDIGRGGVCTPRTAANYLPVPGK